MKRFMSSVLATVMALAFVPAASFAAKPADTAVRRLIKNTSAGPVRPSAGAVTVQGAENFPDKFDLRAADFDGSGELKNYVTPVKNQGVIGTCWGFAAIACAETGILTELGIPYDEWKEKSGCDWDMDLSEHHLAWFLTTPLPEDDESGQGGEGMYGDSLYGNDASRMNCGGSPSTATSVLSQGIGPMLEEDYPYRGKEGNIFFYDDKPYCYDFDDDWSIDESERFGQIYPLEETFKLPDPATFEYDEETQRYKYVYNPAGTAAIKEQLLLGRPVSIGYACDVSGPDENSPQNCINFDTWAQYTPLNYYEDETYGLMSDHMVTVVGWDDNYPRENFLEKNGLPPGDGAWIVKNSWGAAGNEFPNRNGWGIDGYFYLSYYDHTLTALEALDFDLENTDSDYYYQFKYDFMPTLGYQLISTVYEDRTAMANNFYTGDVPVALKTLTLNTNTPDTTTSFKVYKLHDGSQNPTDGELLYSGTKSYRYGGYHRIDLDRVVILPADTEFSVVVENLTSDGKYEVVNNYNSSQLAAECAKAGIEPDYIYARSVVNEGESTLGEFFPDGGEEWSDWGTLNAQETELSEEFFAKAGLYERLDAAVAAAEQVWAAAEKYDEEHGTDIYSEVSDLAKETSLEPAPSAASPNAPEELVGPLLRWKEKLAELNDILYPLTSGQFDLPGLGPEELENASNMAFFTIDNFPICAIADPISEVDYSLYYDSATSKLYKTGDPETGVYSDPVEFPGASGDGDTLTLTSDFQFFTTAHDGLYIPAGARLYVPEGESPSIHSGVLGVVPDSFNGSTAGLITYPDAVIEIDGHLDVTSGDAVNLDSWAILSMDNMELTGSGSLYARGGDSMYDPSLENTRGLNSDAIYAYGNLDISLAEVTALGGDAYVSSMAIVAIKPDIMDTQYSVTIENGANVTAKGGRITAPEGSGGYSCGVAAKSLTVKDGAALTAEGGESANLSNGLNFYTDGGGVTSVTLSNGGSITAKAPSEQYGVALASTYMWDMSDPEADGPSKCTVTMDGSSTFYLSGGKCAVWNTELSGAVAVTDGGVAQYSPDTNRYAGPDGLPACEMRLLTYGVEYRDGAAELISLPGSYAVIFAAYGRDGSLEAVDVEKVGYAEAGIHYVEPTDFDPGDCRVKVMVWSDVPDMRPLCGPWED